MSCVVNLIVYISARSWWSHERCELFLFQKFNAVYKQIGRIGFRRAQRISNCFTVMLVMSLYAVAAVRVNDQRRNDAWEEAKDAE